MQSERGWTKLDVPRWGESAGRASEEAAKRAWLAKLDAPTWGAAASAMAEVVAERLSAARPQKADYFAKNYQSLMQMLSLSKAQIAASLRATAPNHFVAMHDVSLYLEADFPISPSGFLLTNSHGRPSARHLRDLQDIARADGASCVFYEPQLSKRLVSQLAADMDLPLVMLDPLGASDGDVATYWGAIGTALESCFNR